MRLENFYIKQGLRDRRFIEKWINVRSQDNPADIITGGAYPEPIIKSKLWWHSSPWLSKYRELWPEQKLKRSAEIPEEIPVHKNINVVTL